VEYYDKDKPSFVTEHADFVALIFSAVVLAGSWLWELKRWRDAIRKIGPIPTITR
jgi:hypothetical protein